jgi:signal transduction histidine kinase
MFQITPENIFVFYSFEAILSGLLALVLAWVIYKNRRLRKDGGLLLLLGALCSLAFAFFLCSSLNFYEFYFQEEALQRDPEAVACSFFFFAALFLGAAFNRPLSFRSTSALLPTAGAGLGVVHLMLHILKWGEAHVPLHFLGISILLGMFLLFSRGQQRKRQLQLFFMFTGFSASFLLFFLLESSSNQAFTIPLWMGRHLALLGSLLALAHVIESDAQDLFVRFFIRLNLTFIILAGFIIVVVARVQREEYMAFAAREAEDLTEFLRGHVMYFQGQGYDERRVLNSSEISTRIVADFGNISDLQSVAIQLKHLQLEMNIDPEGIIQRVIQERSPPSQVPEFEPAIDGNVLRLSAPIYGSDQITGWVELRESLSTMNKGISHQIMIIFSAFTVIVILSGILVGIIVTQADTTIRKQYQELEETHKQLLQAGKLAALGEMAGGVAHEINNPLGVILGRADYLGSRAKLRKDEELLEDLQVIEENAARAGRIISDLLDFARPHPLNLQQYDLNSLLTQTVELMEPRLSSRKLAMRQETISLPPVEMDWDRMLQVFVNLLNNSIDACQEGGAIRLQTHLSSSGSRVEVTVEDDGVGISKEELKKVFDPFFTTKPKGTGLGLSVSYSIVRDHGGEIALESQPGQGSRFTVSLPVAEGGQVS